MKTKTATHILAIVRESGGARPVDLTRRLGLSPQAVHRHLRRLLAAGQLERLGRGPRTKYRLAGAPRLEEALGWYASSTEPEASTEFVCETRDAFSGGLPRLAAFSEVVGEQALPLLIAVVGEIGNNCFDHNLGRWRDAPGCWFETQATGGRLWLCIADRGQGVLRSLSRVDPSLCDEQAALLAAFERTLSGRAPENRGNGLKFVRNAIVAERGRGLACRSGTGLLDYGALGAECRAQLERFPAQPAGTVTVVVWGQP